MFEESCWYLYGVRSKTRFWVVPRFYSQGTVSSVDFDWKDGLNPFLLGWIHSHPPVVGTTPSDTDNRTMRSWVKALNRPMICGIICDEERVWYEYYRRPDMDGLIWRAVPVVRKFLGGYYGYGRFFSVPV